MSTSIIESVEINNTKLFFSISKNQENKPIILYLHGGPGDSCIPLTKKFNSPLEKSFVFVNLEQRGSGLSYYKFSKNEKLTTLSILEDIHQFVIYLLNRLKQDKLILMGHSWGTFLGLLFIQIYPELISQYIGIGQVVNMSKNIKYQKAFLNQQAKSATDIKNLETDENTMNACLFLTKQVVANGGSLYRSKNYKKLIIPFIFSKDYSLKDLVHRLQGSKQSFNLFWNELSEVNFEKDLDFKVPIIFCEGRHDHHVSSELVAKYAMNIKSPNKIIWFEQSAHFPQWEEPNKFNKEIKSALKHHVD
ncbi:alpha/beta fold hydrolase [Bombilactobacillus bombi]|uniref:alpha/beta fold hydrolase n=1 Tax=Bombilactobacillus bombi TaxID=1303590 RepID=UPI0015E626B6|nr:alpha/beta hydrolase [Bombilactobacillus bombi]MBA1434954.1 alpha/beta hydrolase [Bombilactobacillus bombi]